MLNLVLLPGLDGTGELFDPLVALLGTRFNARVVRYPAKESMGYAELESIARASLPTHEPFILLGESFSGPIAISLASTHPSQLKGLILCCSFARNPRPYLGNFHPLIKFLPIKPGPISILRSILLGRFSTPALGAMLSHATNQVAPFVFASRIAEVVKVDVSSKLAAIAVPILYLQASDDRVVPRSSAKHVVQINPRTRVETIEAPHFLLQAASVAAARAIDDFAQEVQKGS